MEKQRETKAYISQFVKEREEWRREEVARQEEENRRIEEFARMQDQRVQEVVEKKKGADEARDTIYNKVTKRSNWLLL